MIGLNTCWTYGSERIEVQIHLRNTELGAVAVIPLDISWRFKDGEWFAWVTNCPFMFKSDSRRSAIDLLIAHMELVVKKGGGDGE